MAEGGETRRKPFRRSTFDNDQKQRVPKYSWLIKIEKVLKEIQTATLIETLPKEEMLDNINENNRENLKVNLQEEISACEEIWPMILGEKGGKY